MKRPQTKDEKPPFNGHLRHYHRSGTGTPRTWDEWVDGKTSPSWISRNRWNVIGVTLAVLVLVAIIAGLIIELR